jgi:ribonuclease HI
MKLAYGKYKDRDIQTVPRDYLEWLLTSNRETVAALEAELARRGDERTAGVTPPVPAIGLSGLKVFCDGLCEPTNPNGWACWAFVAFSDGARIHEEHGCVGRGEGMSNNVAEWWAVRAALRWLDAEYDDPDAVVMTDSKLVVEQINGRWDCNARHLLPLRNEGQHLLFGLPRVTVRWIPREQNEVADHLTRVAYDEARRVA